MQSIDEAAAAVLVAVEALHVELKGMDLVKRAVDNLKQVVTNPDDPPGRACCLPKYPGEPVFVLVGRDKFAVETISHWLYLAEQQSAGLVPTVKGEKQDTYAMNPAKFDDAVDVLERFKQWRVENPDKMKVPD